MRKILLFTISYCLSLIASAAEEPYAVSKIAPVLLKNAHAVVRMDDQRYELRNLEKIVILQRRVITVLDEEGDKYAELVEKYDRFNSIETVEGTLYDASGKKIKTLKKNDVRDMSMYSETNLAVDGRLKVHNFYHKVYPYTVEYYTEQVKKETMFFPQWIPVPGEFVSVEKSGITIEVPANYVLRYKVFNYNVAPAIKEMGEKKEYRWEVQGLPSIVGEYASPGWRKITPSVMLAPSEFIIEDYKGKMTDWKELGFFQASLNKGRDVLPAHVKAKVQELTAGLTSTREKVYNLYKYLQSNTRYVSVQMGIGGWRPFEASYVSSMGYGDCKALSNYMYSLLKEAGITSYYTLIKAGDHEEDIIADFPSRQFNHAIICVPDQKDTIWLECTSQTKAFGYMGASTGNRHALLITEEGGKLVRTPTYGVNENVALRRIRATLDEQATLSVKVTTSYAGTLQDDMHSMINVLSKEKVKEYLEERFDFSTYEVSSFDYKEKKSLLPVIDESMDIIVSNYATITGKRLFITPNVMSRAYQKLSADIERKYDIELNNAYRKIDTVEIELPPGYEPEAMPKDVIVSSPFGKYASAVKLSGSKLIYYRSAEYYSGRFPPTDYSELVKFYEAIYKADRARAVLVKKEAEEKKPF
jgi:hypothetical protein